MIKINETLRFKGENFKRISISAIKSLCNSTLTNKVNKITLYVHTSKANIESPWINGMMENTFKGGTVSFSEVEKWLNEVSYYNCNNEMGNALHYYIKAI